MFGRFFHVLESQNRHGAQQHYNDHLRCARTNGCFLLLTNPHGETGVSTSCCRNQCLSHSHSLTHSLSLFLSLQREQSKRMGKPPGLTTAVASSICRNDLLDSGARLNTVTLATARTTYHLLHKENRKWIIMSKKTRPRYVRLPTRPSLHYCQPVVKNERKNKQCL